MPKNPLAEVFGFPVNNMSQEAVNHREGRLCPYHNPSGLNCTKSSATDPLGVCSIYDKGKIVVTCPIRLRQDLTILADAARFFFPDMQYVALTEARLKDKDNKAAGNIDIVLVALNDFDEIVDFGAVEIQAVYITGNVKNVFNEYMKDPAANHSMEWPSKNYPSPDYLSSSRKRLVPQLMFKGGILHDWGKKMAVVVHSGFFELLPPLEEVSETKADLAWLIYDLKYDTGTSSFRLERTGTKYTDMQSVLKTISTPTVGSIDDFVDYLQGRVNKGTFSVAPAPSSIEPIIEPLPDFPSDEE